MHIGDFAITHFSSMQSANGKGNCNACSNLFLAKQFGSFNKKK